MRRLSTFLAIAAAGAAVLITPASAGAGVTGTEGPVLISATVSDVTATSAVLHSVVAGGGSPATWHLQWSEDESYSHETTGGGWEAGYTPSLAITGLTPNTVYRYRALSGLWHGFSGGADEPLATHQAIVGTFTTLIGQTLPPPVPPPIDTNVCHNPSIASAEPTIVMVGERIVLTGSGFGTGGVLKFGDAVATAVESWTPTVIAARVPTGAGPDVTVTCADGTSSHITITIVAPANQPPVAVVDDLGSAARPALDSSGSFDVDGVIVRRAWTSRTRKLSTKVVYRPKLKPGARLKVTLTVWDASGASDHVSVTVRAPKAEGREAGHREDHGRAERTGAVRLRPFRAVARRQESRRSRARTGEDELARHHRRVRQPGRPSRLQPLALPRSRGIRQGRAHGGPGAPGEGHRLRQRRGRNAARQGGRPAVAPDEPQGHRHPDARDAWLGSAR